MPCVLAIVCRDTINPYNAEILLYKPWRLEGYF